MANPVYNTASTITRRSGSYSGKGMLTAELLVGFAIIAIRVVANYEVQEGGAVKGTVLRPQGEYGPMAVFSGMVAVFFILSFLAASGGLKAKLAVIFGGIVILSLGVKSLPDIEKVSGTIGKIGTVQVPDPSGNQESVLGPLTASSAPAQGPPNAGNSAGNNPTGFVPVPNTGGGEVFSQSGQCPNGWTLSPNGKTCIAPLQTTIRS